MTKDEIVQLKKNTALNEIRRLFHPLAKIHYDEYSDESYAEQRDRYVRYIIEALEKELETFKKQYKTE